MSNRFDRHCEGCGFEGDFEDVYNPGSDVVPVNKCPQCETVSATRCGCDNPGGHW